MRLTGTSVMVIGAGLAGLSAAVRLMKDGARVTVVEARSRVGGRFQTIRDVFAAGQHAEAGGDFIDHGQQDIRQLADEYGLPVRPILRRGFSFVRYKAQGMIHGRPVNGERAWKPIMQHAKPLVDAYHRAEQRGKALSPRASPSDRLLNGSMRSTPMPACGPWCAGSGVSSWPIRRISRCWF
jgi:monoamine oxidase